MGIITRVVTTKQEVHTCDYCENDAMWASCAWCGKDFCEEHGVVVIGDSVQVGYQFFSGYLYLAACKYGHIGDPPFSWKDIQYILSHLKYQEVRPV